MLRQDYIGYISASGYDMGMKSFGSYLSMECQTLAGYHEFSRKLREFIPEKPKIWIKSPRVTIAEYDHHFTLDSGVIITTAGAGENFKKIKDSGAISEKFDCLSSLKGNGKINVRLNN